MPAREITVSRLALIAGAVSLGACFSARAADVTVPDGTTVSGQKIIGGTDKVTVGVGSKLTSSANPTVYDSTTAASGVVIDNSGTIESTGTGTRAIRFNFGTAMTFTLTNRAGATIQSQNDAIQVGTAVTSGTILVDNYGTIQSTGVNSNNGQAIDFGNIVAGTASVTVDNHGTVQSADSDGIRPGNNGTVNNWGTITGNNYLTNSGADGVDFQTSTSGTVHNYAGGVITGGRHGINVSYSSGTNSTSSSITVINDLGGQIIGTNGSGFGSDVSGSVTNWGTITGTSNTISGVTAGDGDGVDIDYQATIENHGTIQGTGAKGIDSTGNANLSEGLSIGGGTVHNYAGATISGYGRGITVTGNDITVGVTDKAYFAFDLTNEGTISGLALNADGSTGGNGGSAIRLYSDQANTITNSGTISGAGSEAAIWFIGTGNNTITNSGTITATGTGPAILFGDGNDQLNVRTGSVINGVVDGGAGTDAIDLSGTGTAAAPGVFAGAVNFESLAVSAGVWRLTGTTQSYSSGITVASGATLDAAGTIGSSVSVASGATLVGTGSIGTLSLSGTVAPGSLAGAAGTLTVNGDVNFLSGSTYRVNAAADGTAGKIAATGAVTISGASVAVKAAPGAYAASTSYAIVTAASVTGTFASVSTDLAFLTPTLRYGANEVDLVLARNATTMGSVGTNANQRAVGHAIDLLPTNSPLYLSLVGASAASARTAFDQLSGEGNAAAQGTAFGVGGGFTGGLTQAGGQWHDGTAGQGLAVVTDGAPAPLAYGETEGERKPAKPRIVGGTAPAAQAWRLWASGFGGAGARFADASEGTAGVTSNAFGGMIGVDTRIGGEVVLGIAVGGSQSRYTVTDRASHGSADGLHIAPYARFDRGPWSIATSLAWSNFDNTTRRTIYGAGLTEDVKSGYSSQEWRARFEIDRDVAFGGARLTPFVALEAAHLSSSAHTETRLDGSASTLGLTTRAGSTWSVPLFVGLGAQKRFDLGEGRSLTPAMRLAWVHEFSTARDETSAFTAGSGGDFVVHGARAAADSLHANFDVTAEIARSATLFGGVEGEFSSRGRVLVGKGGVRFAW